MALVSMLKITQYCYKRLLFLPINIPEYIFPHSNLFSFNFYFWLRWVFIAVRRLLIAVASLVAERTPNHCTTREVPLI